MSARYYAAGGKESGIVGYCFYHRQDMEYALKFGELSLPYGDIAGDGPRGVVVGERIRNVLGAAGLDIAWSGSIADKLNIKKFKWQRCTNSD